MGNCINSEKNTEKLDLYKVKDLNTLNNLDKNTEKNDVLLEQPEKIQKIVKFDKESKKDDLKIIKDNIIKFTYDNYNLENTPLFTFEGIKEDVKILRCLDGDTVDIALRHKETGLVYKHRVRMFGIDTPEMHPKKDKPNRDEEIKLSILARDALENLCKENNYIVLAHFMKDDKYGRRMAKFFTKDGICINEWMVKQGHAKEYDGGKKEGF